MSELIRVLIVDDIASTLTNLSKLLGFEADIQVVGTARSAEEGIALVHQLHPHIVLMDLNMPGMDGVTATQKLANEASASAVIMMSVQGERDYLRRAMQVGVREFLIKPFSGEELVSSVRRVYQLENRKASISAPAQTGGHSLAKADQPGTVILVFSAKGGTGKSLLALNLAACCATIAQQSTALVDLDLQFGDQGVLLNLDATQSISDLTDASAEVDADLLSEVMIEGPAGMRVLLAPVSPELADLVTPTLVRTVLGQLRRSFAITVVDTAATLNDVSLEAIEQADKIVLITTLGLASIKDAKMVLKVFESLGVPRQKIALVLNRCDDTADFSSASVESSLRFPIALQLPFDRKQVSVSIQRGVPFTIQAPEADISKRVRELAARLLPSESEESSRDLATAGGKKRNFWSLSA